MSTERPFAGVTVVEFGHFIAVPWAGQVLADGGAHVIKIEPPTSPTPAARRMVSAAASGASPKPFSRSAETGRSVAAAMAPQCASASSRVTAPSRRPSTPACAPLEVASAGNPSAARARAEPASHAFAITNARGPRCRARRVAALSL